MSYFIAEDPKLDKSTILHMRTIPGELNFLITDEPLLCGDEYIPPKHKWNGASVGLLEHVPLLGFPKWKHPIATCRHDWRCSIAKTKEERAIADTLFRKDIGEGGTKWEQTKGYIGVRIGSYGQQIKKWF